MIQMIRVKPAVPGTIVRDPVTLQPLKEVGDDGLPGELKPHDINWAQRLRDRDVVIVGETLRVDGPQAPIAPLVTR